MAQGMFLRAVGVKRHLIVCRKTIRSRDILPIIRSLLFRKPISAHHKIHGVRQIKSVIPHETNEMYWLALPFILTGLSYLLLGMWVILRHKSDLQRLYGLFSIATSLWQGLWALV